MPPTSEQMRQLNRDLSEKVLDRAASDPAWKQQLLDDPEAAMRAANFPESQRLEEIRQKEEGAAEVRGQQRVADHYDLSGSSIDPGAPSGPEPCYWTCGYRTWYYTF